MPEKKPKVNTGGKLVNHASSSSSGSSAHSNNPSQTQSHSTSGDDSNKQIAIIGDEDTVIGFGLTGVKHLSPISTDDQDDEIIAIIKEYIQNSKIGFVLITQNVAERVRHTFELLKQAKALYPIFIELPDKHGELPDREDPIKTLIRRAIGMEISKNE
jgi:vacuolar-type H+-ATPase subunit F/Vma7